MEALPLQPELSRRPWLADHRVQGQAVLPAVEAMQLLAMAAVARGVTRTVAGLQAVSFPRFLPLEGDDAPANVAAELSCDAAGITARLTSLHTGRTGVRRTLTHAALRLGPPATPTRPTLARPPADAFRLTAERLYAELVPLGPVYRNLQGELRLWPAGALATISGGRRPEAAGPLGSPFALDAAFHAACAWSQRYARCVAYPVALAARSIFAPTRSDRRYHAWVEPRGQQGERLLFHLWLCDLAGGVCESIEDLAMGDVSGGRLQPPPWIVA